MWASILSELSSSGRWSLKVPAADRARRRATHQSPFLHATLTFRRRFQRLSAPPRPPSDTVTHVPKTETAISTQPSHPCHLYQLLFYVARAERDQAEEEEDSTGYITLMTNPLIHLNVSPEFLKITITRNLLILQKCSTYLHNFIHNTGCAYVSPPL